MATGFCSPEAVKLQVRISNKRMMRGEGWLRGEGCLELGFWKQFLRRDSGRQLLQERSRTGVEKQDRDEKEATAETAELEERTVCLSLGVMEGFPPSPSLSSPRGRSM